MCGRALPVSAETTRMCCDAQRRLEQPTSGRRPSSSAAWRRQQEHVWHSVAGSLIELMAECLITTTRIKIEPPAEIRCPGKGAARQLSVIFLARWSEDLGRRIKHTGELHMERRKGDAKFCAAREQLRDYLQPANKFRFKFYLSHASSYVVQPAVKNIWQYRSVDKGFDTEVHLQPWRS